MNLQETVDVSPTIYDDVVRPEPGARAVVLRNSWHTACVAQSARMLFITPGEWL